VLINKDCNGKEAIRVMKSLDANSVSQIIIKPFSNRAYKSLSEKNIYIQEKDKIIKIIDFLKNANDAIENHPHSIWNCILVLKLSDGRIFDCHISCTDNNGTLIYINSNEDYGWHYAVFKNNKLKALLESIVVSTN
jgi:hypothetical protein